jgi:hypothetical protein
MTTLDFSRFHMDHPMFEMRSMRGTSSGLVSRSWLKTWLKAASSSGVFSIYFVWFGSAFVLVCVCARAQVYAACLVDGRPHLRHEERKYAQSKADSKRVCHVMLQALN